MGRQNDLIKLPPSRLTPLASVYEVDVAKQQYFPSPSVQYGTGRNGRRTLNAGITQPIWSFGRLEAGLDRAKASEDAAEITIADTQQQLAMAVVDEWSIWEGATSQSEVLSQTLERYAELEVMILRRVQAGRSSQADVDFIRSRISQAEGEATQAHSTALAALQTLRELTGLDVRDDAVARSITRGYAPAWNLVSLQN